MKKFRFFLAALVIGTALIINGCDDDNNPVDPGPGAGSVTLNGGGYDNQTVNLASADAIYDPEDDVTTIVLYGSGNNSSARVVLSFMGMETGTYDWEEADNNAVFYTNISTPYTALEGSTTITTYGAVNNNVVGNLTGIVTRADLTDSISISGNFTARRIADGRQN